MYKTRQRPRFIIQQKAKFNLFCNIFGVNFFLKTSGDPVISRPKFSHTDKVDSKFISSLEANLKRPKITNPEKAQKGSYDATSDYSHRKDQFPSGYNSLINVNQRPTIIRNAIVGEVQFVRLNEIVPHRIIYELWFAIT